MALRKTKLKRRSKSKVTVDKADRQLQNWHRKEYEGTKCEGECGRQFEVMHHHNEKSKSNAGRYLHDNLIFLCNKCHASIHFSNHNVVAIYSTRRGNEWVDRMKILKNERRSPYTKRELEQIIERYKLT